MIYKSLRTFSDKNADLFADLFADLVADLVADLGKLALRAVNRTYPAPSSCGSSAGPIPPLANAVALASYGVPAIPAAALMMSAVGFSVLLFVFPGGGKEPPELKR